MTPVPDQGGWVGVTCLYCKTGAEHVPEVGPGDGWIWIAEHGWACPAHAAMAHTSEMDDLTEKLTTTKATLLEAERLRDKHSAEIKRLRGWIESYQRGDWDHSRAEFARMALCGYDVPRVDDRLIRDSAALDEGRPE